MKIKQEPPTDSGLLKFKAADFDIDEFRRFIDDVRNLRVGIPVQFDDHRSATTPPEPIAVHGEGE